MITRDAPGYAGHLKNVLTRSHAEKPLRKSLKILFRFYVRSVGKLNIVPYTLLLTNIFKLLRNDF